MNRRGLFAAIAAMALSNLSVFAGAYFAALTAIGLSVVLFVA